VNRKPFDQQLHDDNDPPSREAVQEFITRAWGLKTEEGPKYDVDLYVIDKTGMYKGAVEIERRHNWVDSFPFKTVHVPYRKAKFFGFFPTILFVLRSDMKQGLWAHGSVIVESPVVKVDNKYVNDEPFFDVPLSKWTRVQL
jgi:hypothetical protein